MKKKRSRRHKRNHGRSGESDLRGNNKDRALRKRWMIKTFGNGKVVPCVHCRKKLTYETVTADRIVPGCHGGRYTHGNIQPACKKCNDSRNQFECAEETEAQKAEAMFRTNPRRKTKYKTVRRIKSKINIYRRRRVVA